MPIERAPAKVNLSLHVLGRRQDGYHELESLVVFADLADALSLAPGGPLGLTVAGCFAGAAGPIDDNLVLRAARALGRRVPGLTLGRFAVEKRIPAAAGLGGGSADAAAALRLLARANRLAPDDPRILAAAAETGADVPVCLVRRPALMRGIGEQIERLDLPDLHAVLANPRIAVATAAVFAELGLSPGERGPSGPHLLLGDVVDADHLRRRLRDARNDLEPAARRIVPEIGAVSAALSDGGAELVRMSGSGATVFALVKDAAAARSLAAKVARRHRTWWLEPVRLGSGLDLSAPPEH